jgi:dihydropteroate synthase
VGSAVAAAFAVQAGASIIRAHDVAATVDAVKVAVALRDGALAWRDERTHVR